MIPLLRSASAPGRPYVVFATDELVPAKFNFNNSPLHIIGLIADNTKLVARTINVEGLVAAVDGGGQTVASGQTAGRENL